MGLVKFSKGILFLLLQNNPRQTAHPPWEISLTVELKLGSPGKVYVLHLQIQPIISWIWTPWHC